MKRVQGNPDVALIECVNPVKNKWRVRWDVTPDESGSAFYMEEEFSHLPSGEEIRQLISGWVNKQTDAHIRSGYMYEGKMVWLSTENQLNYKAAYDLAVQTDGASLPVEFKLGTDDEPEFVVFDTLDRLKAFYVGAIDHVQTALKEGWTAKNAIDLDRYRVN